MDGGAVDEFAAPQRVRGVDAEVVAERSTVGSDGQHTGVGGGFAAHGFFEDLEADHDVHQGGADGAVFADRAAGDQVDERVGHPLGVIALAGLGVGGVGVDAEQAQCFAFDGVADGVAFDGVEVEGSAEGPVCSFLEGAAAVAGAFVGECCRRGRRWRASGGRCR